MADVRLTATNPEDSSVVPVACDAAGRLLLEEPQVIEGPPGPPGEPGPPGQDGQNGQDGDPFSGNFADDVTFGGSALFEGNVGIGTRPTPAYQLSISSEDDFFEAGLDTVLGQGTQTLKIISDAYRGGGRTGDIAFYVNSADNEAARINSSGDVLIGGTLPSPKISLNADGSAVFAGNKAGFTAEGYLWCTTSRGDTVMLNFTSNGAGQWVDYTPTTRIEEIRDKLDANRPETGEMPADTP